MTEVFGVLGDLSKWPKDDNPVREKTVAECHAEWEEQRRYEREVQELIDEALGGREAKHLAGERERNEAALSAYVDDLLMDELGRIIEKRLPSEKVREKYVDTFREFQKFCRELGVGWLPAKGATMFSWLTHDRAPEKVAQRTRALRFMHDVSREYFDERYIAAAERWSRLKPQTEKDTKDNG